MLLGWLTRTSGFRSVSSVGFQTFQPISWRRWRGASSSTAWWSMTLVKLICLGETGSTAASQLANRLRTRLQSAQVNEELSPILAAAFTDMIAVTTTVAVLQGDDPPSTKILDEVATARGNATQLFRQALGQQAYWKKKEQKLRELAVALTAMMPPNFKFLILLKPYF